MFCYQCEQTSKGYGCTTLSVCGKDETTAILQDLLIYAVKGISQYAHRARELGAKDNAIDTFVVECLFTTVTNVNFDPLRMQNWLIRAGKMLDKAKRIYEEACAKAGKSPEALTGPTKWRPAPTVEELVNQGKGVNFDKKRKVRR